MRAAGGAPSVEVAPEAALVERLDALERIAAALEPDAAERLRLRDAVVATGERFLEGLGTTPAYQETEDKGSDLLRAPISEHGRPIEEILAMFEHDVVRPG